MPPFPAIAGVVVSFIGAILAIRIARGGADSRLDRRARQRIRRRIDAINRGLVVSDPLPTAGSAATLEAGPSSETESAPAVATPHRRLWRDTSIVLVGLGAGLVVLLAAGELRFPAGGVLDLTATPPPADTPATVASEAAPSPTTAALVSTAPTEAAAPSVEPATPRPTAAPTERPDRTPSADRLAVLTPCPGRTDCYVYTVRRGDNLQSIASWFGISYTTVLRMNPDIVDPGQVHAGDSITLPTPRR